MLNQSGSSTLKRGQVHQRATSDSMAFEGRPLRLDGRQAGKGALGSGQLLHRPTVIGDPGAIVGARATHRRRLQGKYGGMRRLL